LFLEIPGWHFTLAPERLMSRMDVHEIPQQWIDFVDAALAAIPL
jgi:hypothetical protein